MEVYAFWVAESPEMAYLQDAARCYGLLHQRVHLHRDLYRHDGTSPFIHDTYPSFDFPCTCFFYSWPSLTLSFHIAGAQALPGVSAAHSR